MLCLFHASEPVGHPYPGKGKLTPGILYPFIKRHPGLKIILAHWGGGLPFYSLMPEVKQALSNVWFDTAASSFLYNPAIYEQIIGIAGAERILFGSDYPLVSQKRPLDEIDKLNLDSGVKTKILGSNIAGILGLNNG
jgi:predicted TIM-barrel fold metal-dependent hydrolase